MRNCHNALGGDEHSGASHSHTHAANLQAARLSLYTIITTAVRPCIGAESPAFAAALTLPATFCTVSELVASCTLLAASSTASDAFACSGIIALN